MTPNPLVRAQRCLWAAVHHPDFKDFVALFRAYFLVTNTGFTVEIVLFHLPWWIDLHHEIAHGRIDAEALPKNLPITEL